MRKVLSFGLVILLFAALLSSCGKKDSETASESAPTPSAAQQESLPEEAALRSLVSWDSVTLCGTWSDALDGGFEALSFSGPYPAEDAASSSVSFSMGRKSGAGDLKISGFIYLGKDASNLFDFDADEPGDEPADGPVNDYDTALFDMAAGRIKEAGGTVQQKDSNGILWNYGFADAGMNGASTLCLLAWAEIGGGVLYVDITAADTSGASLDSARKTMEDWLLGLTVTGAPDAARQKMRIPFGAAAFTAEEFDLLRFYGTNFAWNAGEGYLDAGYSGSKDDYSFYCTLQNRAAAGDDAADAAAALAKDPLDSNLSWKTNRTGNTLTAVAPLEGDTLVFKLVLEPYGNASCDEAFAFALDWLKTMAIQ